MDDWSSAKLCDVADLILGMILFFSPWLFDLSTGVQWQAASTIGILIAVLSIAALAGYTTLTGIDVFLARHFLAPVAAGLYAAAAIAGHIHGGF